MDIRLAFVATILSASLSPTTGAFCSSRLTTKHTQLQQAPLLSQLRLLPNRSKKRRASRDVAVPLELRSWLADTFESLGLDITIEKLKYNQQDGEKGNNNSNKHGTVIRTAAKAYRKDGGSEPSSSAYTPRKGSRAQIHVGPDGVQNDYNHYRTIALDSSPDRAVSILTTDVLKLLKKSGWKSVREGDLGENIFVDDVDYKFFQVGNRYKFTSSSNDKNKNNSNREAAANALMGERVENDGVLVVEITEKMEPCGNLCKLPYINDTDLPPKERFESCKRFLLRLDEKDGLRGWYGKVIGNGGIVKVGDRVSPIV